jgi:hypothetical protein
MVPLDERLRARAQEPQAINLVLHHGFVGMGRFVPQAAPSTAHITTKHNG